MSMTMPIIFVRCISKVIVFDIAIAIVIILVMVVVMVIANIKHTCNSDGNDDDGDNWWWW